MSSGIGSRCDDDRGRGGPERGLAGGRGEPRDGSGIRRPERADGRPWVKVCGITSVEDARMVAELGVEAIGLNFWPGSPRHVTVERAEEIVASLPGSILTVGVFRNAPEEDLDRIAERLRLDRVQLHGDEDAAYCSRRKVTAIKALSTPPGWDPALAAPYRLFPVLVDGYDPALAGGTGQTCDWRAARRLVDDGYQVILAGGLRAENLSAAIEAVAPAAVDLNSGVESSPGRKERHRLLLALQALGRRTAK